MYQDMKSAIRRVFRKTRGSHGRRNRSRAPQLRLGCEALEERRLLDASLQGPTEARFWDDTSAYNGYTLFGMAGNSYLLDMQGRVVNSWPIGTNPRLLDYNGNLLDAIVEVDINGNIVWEWRFFDHVVQDIDPTKTNYVGAGNTIADNQTFHHPQSRADQAQRRSGIAKNDLTTPFDHCRNGVAALLDPAYMLKTECYAIGKGKRTFSPARAVE